MLKNTAEEHENVFQENHASVELIVFAQSIFSGSFRSCYASEFLELSKIEHLTNQSIRDWTVSVTLIEYLNLEKSVFPTNN